MKFINTFIYISIRLLPFFSPPLHAFPCLLIKPRRGSSLRNPAGEIEILRMTAVVGTTTKQICILSLPFVAHTQVHCLWVVASIPESLPSYCYPGPSVHKIVVVDETKTSINGRFACKIAAPDIVWCLFSGIFLCNHLLNLSTPDSFPGQMHQRQFNQSGRDSRWKQNKTNKNILSSSQTYFFGIKQSVSQQFNDHTCTRSLVQFIFPSTCRAFKNLQTSQGPARGKNMFLHHNAFNRIVHCTFDYRQTP